MERTEVAARWAGPRTAARTWCLALGAMVALVVAVELAIVALAFLGHMFLSLGALVFMAYVYVVEMYALVFGPLIGGVVMWTRRGRWAAVGVWLTTPLAIAWLRYGLSVHVSW